MNLKVGDRISFEFDNEITLTGVIYEQGEIEDNQEGRFRWFTRDGHMSRFDMNDPYDVRRVKCLGSNVFE